MNEQVNIEKRQIFESLSDSLIILPIIIYIFVWSYISWTQIFSLNSTYFDLGSFMERLWFIPRYNWTISSFLAVFSNTGLQFFIFPFAYLSSYKLLIIFQSAAIGFCALPTYGISKFFLKSKINSALLALSFLLYFPVAGSNFFNVHFQSFFPILFISGYYFFLRKNYNLSLFLFFLSGTVRYPYFIFPALFALINSLETLYKFKSGDKKERQELRKKMFYLIAICAIGVTFLAMRSLMAGPINNIPLMRSGTAPYHLWDRIITFLLFFAPLLFIPLISKKWILFFSPMIYLIFFGPSIYYYPLIFHDQYALFIYSFVYLGLVEGIVPFRNILNKHYKKLIKTKKRIRLLRDSNHRVALLIITIIIILILMDTVYEPYGPFNSGSAVNYGMEQSLNSNVSAFEALSKV